MRKLLLPIRFFFEVVSLLCFALSYSGLSYLNMILYCGVIFVLLIEVLFTIYDFITKRANILENVNYNSLGIGLFLYVMILYTRLFFDKGMLYVGEALMVRFRFINYHLPMVFLGILSYFIYHICTEFTFKEKAKKKKS